MYPEDLIELRQGARVKRHPELTPALPRQKCYRTSSSSWLGHRHRIRWVSYMAGKISMRAKRDGRRASRPVSRDGSSSGVRSTARMISLTARSVKRERRRRRPSAAVGTGGGIRFRDAPAWSAAQSVRVGPPCSNATFPE
jgi:hypothetical protein